MQNTQSACAESTKTVCQLIAPTRKLPGLLEDARTGLLTKPRSLPPKYFYDARGSQLFEQICETNEYYPTRTEDELLKNHAADIITETRPEQILELGSGNSRKTCRLFDACENLEHCCSYAPFDVCGEILEETADRLQDDYDWLQITPMVGDYHAGLENLPPNSGRRLILFLGSTIGNFTPRDALAFLQEIRESMQPGDYLLLGTDRIKDKTVLDAAYNDKQGITADFNLNLLHVLNRELEATFNTKNFDHLAYFNENESRIEMRLVCNRDHQVSLRRINETIVFKKQEQILTEVSHKYTFAGAEELLLSCGFKILDHYQPENRFFSLILASA